MTSIDDPTTLAATYAAASGIKTEVTRSSQAHLG